MAEWWGWGVGRASRVKKQLLQKGLKCLKMHLLSMVFFCEGWYGLERVGMEWRGLVWVGMGWYGLVWIGMGW